MAKEGVKKMLALSFAVALVIDIAFPLAVAFYLWRRLGVSWRFFLFGALIFAVFQLFTRVPAVAVLQSALGVTQWPAEAVWAWLFGLSLTAGLVEEIGRWVGYRWLFKPAERTWDNALMYGAGHGGLESILLVGLLGVLPSLINVLVFSQTPPDRLSVPPEAAAQIQQLLTLSWWLPLLGGFERIAAVIFHIGMSVVVLQVFARSRMVWLWLAVALHTLVNISAVGANRVWGAVASEVIVGAFALLAIWLIFRLRPAVRTSARGG